jgi:hypothetical protein
MCKDARSTAVALMTAVEPTLKSLLSFLGQTNTTAGRAVITAYDAALAALQDWTQGTTAENVLELITDFQNAFNALTQAIPLPPGVSTLVNVILAGIEAVIGVIAANSPAPAAPAGATATPEEATAAHQAAVAHDTEAKVTTLVPTFKRSIWHSAASQYKSTWNKAIDSGGFPSEMKAA